MSSADAMSKSAFDDHVGHI